MQLYHLHDLLSHCIPPEFVHRRPTFMVRGIRILPGAFLTNPKEKRKQKLSCCLKILQF